jgi:hypothetical protein
MLLLFRPPGTRIEPHVAVVDRKGCGRSLRRSGWRTPRYFKQHADEFLPLQMFSFTTVPTSWEMAHQEFFTDVRDFECHLPGRAMGSEQVANLPHQQDEDFPSWYR